MTKSAISSVLFAALILPVAAQASGPRKAVTANNDPNRIVCRSSDTTGSRLTQTKRCQTLAQWAQDKQVDRQEVEHIQSNRYKNN